MYRPSSPLADYTEIIGHWHAHVGYRSRALPRGAVTVIIDVGQRQQLDLYAADGCTKLNVPPAFYLWSRTAAGQRPSPIWPYPGTHGNAGHTRRFRRMSPTRRAATSSRRSRPEA
jgi:hypothetical protein